MKMFTNSDQTAKLIELGFEKPKGWNAEGINSWFVMYKHKDNDEDFNYSIGELIEMLPIELEDVGINTTLTIHFDNNLAKVEYIGVLGIEYSIVKEELIDALYDMIVKLKEEGVI